MKVKISDPSNETTADRGMYLSDFIFELIDELPNSESALKLRLQYIAVDISFYLLLCDGARDKSVAHEWCSARNHAVAFRGLYRLAGRRGLFKIQPEIMVRVDELIKEIDYNITKAEENTKQQEQSEMEPWLKKYKIWKEMQT